MKLGQVLEAASSQVSGGTEFQWKCYPNARYLDIADIDGEEICNVVYSTKDQVVYEVHVFVPEDDIAYCWLNPDTRDDYKNECAERGIHPDVAYDDVMFNYIYYENEILSLVQKIVHKTYVHEHAHVERKVAVDEDEHASNCGYAENVNDTEVEYEVGINVMHILSVKANSMEEAVCKAKKFTKAMRPGEHFSGVSWADSYIAKERVSRELAVEHIEE